MEHSSWTPNKNKMSCESIIMLSPIRKTPIQNNVRIRAGFQSNTNNFPLLSSHITPPSSLTKFIARNPFEADLTNKLHISVISPTVFTKVSNPNTNSSSDFTWSIDELAIIQPAKIDEFPEQQMQCSDPEIEKNAQEAISKFFNENQIIPSPFDVKRTELEKKIEIMARIQDLDEINMSKESYKSKVETKENWVQTVLSLPPKLPENVEEALKPYFNFTQNQNCESEDNNSSNSSLRRKLFSNHDDSHNESYSSTSSSPVNCKSPLTENLSPLQSGMFFHGTPLQNCSPIIQRTYGTPLGYGKNISPNNLSPIDNPGFNMSCQSIKSRNKSVARLNFSNDMSIEILDDVDKENKQSSKNENICKTLFSNKNEISSEKEMDKIMEEGKFCDITQMFISTESSIKFKEDDKENLALNNVNMTNKSKFTEACKTNFSESYAMQQSNMLSGNYAHQMAHSCTHDTGYQTYSSSSNITSNMDSYNTPIKQKQHWDEPIAQIDDEVQLADWRENMKNMISSTPSKFNKIKNSLQTESC